MYFVFSPKRKNFAKKSCENVLASEPIKLSPIAEIFKNFRSLVELSPFVIKKRICIASAEEKELTPENKKMYEKIVPEIIPCKTTLNKTRKKTSRFLNKKSEKITGKFASPSLKKGSGFGIAFSMVAKNKHNATKKEINF